MIIGELGFVSFLKKEEGIRELKNQKIENSNVPGKTEKNQGIRKLENYDFWAFRRKLRKIKKLRN